MGKQNNITDTGSLPDASSSKLSALLVDMDGTIVDSEPYWITAEHELVSEFGGHWDDDLALSLVGSDLNRSASVLQDAGVDLPGQEIVHRLEQYVAAEMVKTPRWRPGARELLAEARSAGVRLALVTMSWAHFAGTVANMLPEGTFDVVVSGDLVERGKPEPDAYLKAMADLGVDRRECVAIEDSPTGAAAAAAAGVRCLGVPHLVGLEMAAGRTVTESLSGVTLEWLATLPYGTLD